MVGHGLRDETQLLVDDALLKVGVLPPEHRAQRDDPGEEPDEENAQTDMLCLAPVNVVHRGHRPKAVTGDGQQVKNATVDRGGG